MKQIHNLIYLIYLLVLFVPFSYAQYPNYLVDGTGSPEEVTIGINPLNENILAAGSNIDNFYSSTNSGISWSETHIVSNLLGVWGDPVVLFDSLGNLYYAHLSNPVSGWWIDRIVVQKSTNNGINWNDGVGIGLNSYPKQQDKPWLI